VHFISSHCHFISFHFASCHSMSIHSSFRSLSHWISAQLISFCFHVHVHVLDLFSLLHVWSFMYIYVISFNVIRLCRSFIHVADSFIHAFIRSFVYSLTHSLTLPLTHRSFTHFLIRSFLYSSIHSLIHPLTHSFNLFTSLPFVHSFSTFCFVSFRFHIMSYRLHFHLTSWYFM
jgi:hypothetical protein